MTVRIQCFVAWLLVCTAIVSAEDAPKKVLLLSQGPDGHPASTHEYDAGVRILAKCLSELPDLEVESVRADGEWAEGPELLRDCDGAVLYLSQGAKWIHAEPRRLEAFGQLAGRGGGLVAIHWAMGTKDAHHVPGFLELFGGCHGGPDRKYKVLETGLTVAAQDHEILRGIGAFRAHDEFYYRLKLVQSSQPVLPLLTANIDGSEETVAWAWERGDGGRSFGFSGLHFHRNWTIAEYRRLVTQGVAWSLKIPVPRQGLTTKLAETDLKLTK